MENFLCIVWVCNIGSLRTYTAHFTWAQTKRNCVLVLQENLGRMASKKKKKCKRENALYTWQTGERVKVKFSKRLFEDEKYSNITLKEQKLVFQEFNCFL